MPVDFSPLQLTAIALIFVWTGFVRTGLGFGGAALGLPLLLLLYDQPVYWLPIIGAHLLFFSGITLRTRIRDVDWGYLKRVSPYVVPSAVVGVLGLLNLPSYWLNLFIYLITLFYGIMWALGKQIQANSPWVDRLLLVLGGYVAGISLSGAPLMVAVFMRNIARHQLRNTMFVLWFVLVTIKMATFVIVGAQLNLLTALVLLPVAGIGHYLGIKAHDKILEHDALFKRVVGGGLTVICAIGLGQLLL